MDHLTLDEQQQLLRVARQAVEAAANGQGLPEIDRANTSARLFEPGASFVTITEADGSLRGCIGTLEAHQPLVEDVREHAAGAATEDYRFASVTPEEVRSIRIEISRLTTPQPLEYEGPDDLLAKLHPGVDGVILRDGFHRATFLPQVWEKVPDAREFLAHLCLKMGAPANLWRLKKLQVLVYQVEEFHE